MGHFLVNITNINYSIRSIDYTCESYLHKIVLYHYMGVFIRLFSSRWIKSLDHVDLVNYGGCMCC